mmetsp:Transcript_14148/g.38995  ORF Transcript_14148/g.38995 Transcript_14148/m.38995 type:complete len:262 (+) Transcript_14148:40-825(+)
MHSTPLTKTLSPPAIQTAQRRAPSHWWEADGSCAPTREIPEPSWCDGTEPWSGSAEITSPECQTRRGEYQTWAVASSIGVDGASRDCWPCHAALAMPRSNPTSRQSQRSASTTSERMIGSSYYHQMVSGMSWTTKRRRMSSSHHRASWRTASCRSTPTGSNGRPEIFVNMPNPAVQRTTSLSLWWTSRAAVTQPQGLDDTNHDARRVEERRAFSTAFTSTSASTPSRHPYAVIHDFHDHHNTRCCDTPCTPAWRSITRILS